MDFDFDKEFKEEKNSEQLNNLKSDVNPLKSFFGFIWDFGKVFATILAVVIILRYFLIQPYIVDGESMMPYFINKEYVLAEKVSYNFSELERGDVVVFKYPRDPSFSYIKRIIGLPNETVAIENNKIYIYNQEHPEGFVLHEPYIASDVETKTYEKDRFERKLFENEFFVMGDNRPHSSDSREWGALPRNNIMGKVWLTLAPYERLKIHKTMAYDGL